MVKAATLEVEIGAKIDKFERSLGKVRKDLKGMETRLGGVSRGANKATSAFSGMAKRLIAVGIAYFGARGIFRMGKSFLDVATSVETYRLRLEAMLGSQQAATEAMNYFKEVAAKVPFTLEEVIEAGVKVQAFGADLKAWTPIMADLAAFMGVTLPEAAGALGRAFAGGVGAADIFRERGILQVIKDFAKMERGIDDLTKISLPEFRDVMFEAFAGAESKVAGTADKLAETWVGVVSMLQDKWFKFRDTVMKTKVFELMKEGLVSFNESMDKFVEAGQLDKWAKKVAIGVIDTFKVIAMGGQTLLVVFQGVKVAVFAMGEKIVEYMEKVVETMQVAAEMSRLLTFGIRLIKQEGFDRLIGDLKTISEGYHDEVERGKDKIITLVLTFDKLKERLNTAKDAIRDTKEGMGELGEKTKEVAETITTSIANLPKSIIPPSAFAIPKASFDDLEKYIEEWMKNFYEKLGEMEEKFKDTFSRIAYAVSNFFSQIGNLSQVHFDNQLIALDELTNASKDSADARYEADKERIENSMMSEEEKAEALDALEEKKIKDEEKRNKEYEKRKRAIQKKAFEREKKIDLVTATMNIAVAITKALPDWVLAAITAAAGLVQLAAIHAQTFPSLAEGGLIPRPMPVMAGHGPRGEIIASPEKLAAIISREMPGVGSPGMGLAPIQPIVNIYARTLDRYAVDHASEMIYDALEREGRRRG